jgi:hypothetical protein
VQFEGIHPQHFYQMDGIILDFEHILEIIDADVIALHWGQAKPTVGLEKWKFKFEVTLMSVEQRKENSKFVHRLRPSGRICYPHYWHK